jgi:hypothetical protein
MQTRTITIDHFNSFKTVLPSNYVHNSIPASQGAKSVSIRKNKQVTLLNDVTRLQCENLRVKRRTLKNVTISGVGRVA